MEIILTTEDIRTMISDYYVGVEEVKFKGDDNVEIRIQVNPEEFFQKQKKQAPIVQQTPQPPPKPKTLEQQNVERAKKGGMAAGGSARSMMKM